MKPTSTPLLLSLGMLARQSLADDSDFFSQYAGAPTVTTKFVWPNAQLSSVMHESCTDLLNSVRSMSEYFYTNIPYYKTPLADAVCMLCTNVQVALADSCCGQSNSVACFDQFASGGTVTAPPTSASTGDAGTVTSTGGGGGAVAASSTSKALGGRVDVVGVKSTLLAAMLGFVGWLFSDSFEGDWRAEMKSHGRTPFNMREGNLTSLPNTPSSPEIRSDNEVEMKYQAFAISVSSVTRD
ncbi:hypothetical protein QBC42DRAFT_294885 [Cladorrhinum samala]|uniref:Uncharacterized protein n=1 Tax=Cladorrhinum samala TaxID=585594 RepID=A0AAV9HWU9_9PEZI|nr:hypothetical protein QBC42DRAFT_294885 [Cladorrhinum samala]